MVVYADILIILNIIVDYFLLLAAAKLLQNNSRILRLLAGAAIGGVSSLYIFAPDLGLLIGLLFRAAVCALMVLAAFGFKNIKTFLRGCGVLFLVTCGYGGIMTAVWYLFKPPGMTVVNSVVYFSISPAVLIIASVAAYLLFMLFSAIFSKTAKFAERCEITVSAGGDSITMEGIIDTGNSVEDIFGNSEIIIADKAYVKNLFGDINPATNDDIKSRYRLLPCSTVSGGGTLVGFRCDKAFISDGERSVKLEKPILAVSKTPLNDDYSAIVNPRIFM